ncbi:MAG: hypothetical protein NTV97_00580 [Alphaproteobacteria bacterium]|nr:hypothetical protein [Alphaproteobacteria bacterium]
MAFPKIGDAVLLFSTRCQDARRLARKFVSGICLIAAPALGPTSLALAKEKPDPSPPVAGAAISPLDARTIRLTGTIKDGDAARLRAMLTRAGAAASPTVELASPGGDLMEGYRLGSLLKEFAATTVVRKGDTCLSACALAFLGGSARNAAGANRCNLEIGGKVGFHNFWLNPNGAGSATGGARDGTSADPVMSRLQGFNEATGGAARLLRYAAEVGMQPNFVGSLMGRSADELQYIETVGQFLSLGICPIGLAPTTLSRAQEASNVCNHSTGWLDAAAPLQANEIPARKAKRRLLERVQSNMQSARSQPARTKGGLAEQFESGSIMRVGGETDRLYEDLQAAGVALPDIVGPTFEVGRQRGRTFEVVCYVSLSTEDPDRFDVVVQTARGGLAQPAIAPVEGCRRLFRLDRDAVISRGA